MIPVRNVYYMLAYAFKFIDKQGFQNVEIESFDNAGDLCAELLARGVSLQLKKGLSKNYLSKQEQISNLKGKINITDSIKNLSMLRKQMVCTYDEFTINTYENRIIKTTMMFLLKSSIQKSIKKKIKKLLVFFDEVDQVDIKKINWKIHFGKNNQTYRILISICYLIANGMIQTTNDGKMKLMNVINENHLNRLYEKFILEFYRKEFPKLTVNSSVIPWGLDDGFRELLPMMISDIMISDGNKVLIIDAKYYSHNTQVNFNVHTIHSHNMYQIFTYVKNKEYELKTKALKSGNTNDIEVSGMLLYAKTDDEIQPDQNYKMSGNHICVKTLDLNQQFEEIANSLKAILRHR